MTFRSILFEEHVPELLTEAAPACFGDLHLDAIVAAILAGREEYALQPYFHLPLRDRAAIGYRHEVFRDLQDRALATCVRAFAERMRLMRAQLGQAEQLYYERQRQRWFLTAVSSYCEAVSTLSEELARLQPRSAGMTGLRDYVAAYAASASFGTLLEHSGAVRGALAAIRYSLQIDGTRIRVARYAGEPDYAAEVLATFAKFSQGATKDYRFELHASVQMNHVEAAVLDRVALLFPEAFTLLEHYCQEHRTYLDETLRRFDREVQFYLACLEHVAYLEEHGLPCCLPQIVDRCTDVFGREVFDLALAGKLLAERLPVVTNEFELHDPERVVVVSGPNQGGKTTFARTFGQMHYLASLGCPVSGRTARLMLCDRVFSLFERQERLDNLSGKLEEELRRLHDILGLATPASLLIMNETLGSTTMSDALALGRRILQRIIDRGMLCVYVTFLEELASLGPSTVSMVSTVDPKDPVRRTFKVLKLPADGRAYAMSVARRHHLTYDSIRGRVRP